MNDVTSRALRSSLFGIVALAALLFIPAGTLYYWQAWLFMAVFVCTSGAITVYLAICDPKLLERRMNVGPRAEKEPAQKIIMVFAVMIHRFGRQGVSEEVEGIPGAGREGAGEAFFTPASGTRRPVGVHSQNRWHSVK
jgi:hypothetical protein